MRTIGAHTVACNFNPSSLSDLKEIGDICYALFDRVAATELTPTRCERFDGNSDTVNRLMCLYRASFDTSAPFR